ncbi:hypothetical protein RchiOBHm_Chr4g0439021 [Rosa chinensis]|uniref:Uncharacterized protein n=1 Tax=Rosa chinensis TaxID=74649 RepID=A0A2P6R2W4_ROSCH|nr:hypothetical protein RchiOBHm_Chr4g0439021 [Rosa chinensis]
MACSQIHPRQSYEEATRHQNCSRVSSNDRWSQEASLLSPRNRHLQEIQKY